MADWINITDSQVDPDAPLTSEIAYAWRDNPIAIAEGAPGAPRVVVQALDPSGIVLPTVTFSASGWGAVTNLGSVGLLSGSAQFSGSTASWQVQAALSSDNGSTWAASGNMTGTLGAGTLALSPIWFDLTNGWSRCSNYSPVNLTMPGGVVNAVRVRLSAAGSGYFLPDIRAGKP